MVHRFGCGWVESTKCYIIGPGFRCFHREMSAIVAGNTNLCVTPKQFPRFTNIAIALPQMHTICFQPLSQGNAVVHDKRNVMRRANGLQRLRKSRRFMLIQFFDPKLERSYGTSGQSRL
jgi:hypothetical protein